MGESPVVSDRLAARRADPLEETGPTVSMSNLRGREAHSLYNELLSQVGIMFFNLRKTVV